MRVKVGKCLIGWIKMDKLDARYLILDTGYWILDTG
jgi:hypothetical protein